MVSFQKTRRDDSSLHVAIVGKIDERFDGSTVVDEPGGVRIEMDLSGVRAISSLGVRAFEEFVSALRGRDVVMVNISAAIASLAAMIPNFVGLARIESSRLCGTPANSLSEAIPKR